MTSARSQVLATSNFRDWHTVVGKIPWSLVPKTMMDCHSKLVLHSLRNNQPVQIIVHQPNRTRSYFQVPVNVCNLSVTFLGAEDKRCRTPPSNQANTPRTDRYRPQGAGRYKPSAPQSQHCETDGRLTEMMAACRCYPGRAGV